MNKIFPLPFLLLLPVYCHVVLSWKARKTAKLIFLLLYFASILAVLSLFSFMLAGCGETMMDTWINKTSFIIDYNGVTFKPDPPLVRRYGRASIRIGLTKDWMPEPPWNSIKFFDGSRAHIKCFLTDVNGKVYESNCLGMADGLEVSFDPPVPKGVGITQVEIISDTIVECTYAVWHDFRDK